MNSPGTIDADYRGEITYYLSISASSRSDSARRSYRAIGLRAGRPHGDGRGRSTRDDLARRRRLRPYRTMSGDARLSICAERRRVDLESQQHMSQRRETQPNRSGPDGGQPVDGRYRSRTRALADYFSEYALIRYRVASKSNGTWRSRRILRSTRSNRSRCDAQAPRTLQGFSSPTRAGSRPSRRDQSRRQGARVFPQGEIDALGLGLPLEMVHFACTSEDISNLAYALIIKEFARTI